MFCYTNQSFSIIQTRVLKCVREKQERENFPIPEIENFREILFIFFIGKFIMKIQSNLFLIIILMKNERIFRNSHKFNVSHEIFIKL